ncbi:vomeronasal type-1 receptor 4-like [Peromyscus californicus insignis]|uniref:vomeronasal type-1 receptor 4-like n=1 Tax=Peromyscus californicus insignis TaxID=564181 RepID=UPI0022A67DA3|nr:vomeronasal type-1 receptor 4-like [Peromyscus californicus insignis]
MEASDMVIRLIFLSQSMVGVLGNSFLVYNYLLLYFTGIRLRFTDWILQHLIVANFLTLLCKGVPQTMAAFGLKDFLNDFECKLIFYLNRVGRGVTLSSTCFLSVFQAITISPSGSRWSRLKVKSPSYIAAGVYMSWILALIVNITFPMYITAKLNHRNMTSLKEFEYCSSVRHDKAFDIFSAVLLTSPDVFFVGLMLWSSSSMVFILCRHKQRMKHIHRSNFSLRSFPETRATKTILLLVITFVCFYTLSCLVQINISLLYNPGSFLANMASVLNACFPTVSPFLLINH